MRPVRRRKDWRPRLEAVIEEWRGKVWGYGTADCALFAAAAIKAITGRNPARKIRRYRTRKAGIKAVQAKGFANHEEVFAALLPRIPVEEARPGDVAVLGRRTLGIVQGRLVYAMSRHGLAMVSIDEAKRAYRV